MTRKFITVDTFRLTSGNTAHTVYVGKSAPNLGEYVVLDGQIGRVTGVEWPIKGGYTAIIVEQTGDAGAGR
jgi:hypothetical protein